MQLLAVTASLSLFAGGATLAHAEGEPPPTTPEPTTTTVAPPPAPEGAFGWELAGKPPPRRANPVVPSPSTGTSTSPAAPVVTTTTTTAASSPRPVRHVKLNSRQKRPAPLPHLVRPRRTGAVLGVETTGASRYSYTFVLTVAALSLAIACFALGSVPSAQVRWRRGAAFIAYRRTDVTIVGFVCLLAAAIVYVLTQNR